MIHYTRILICGLILALAGYLQEASAQDLSAEKRAQYLEIQKIKDPEQRIVSEYELVLLGTSERETKRNQN